MILVHVQYILYILQVFLEQLSLFYQLILNVLELYPILFYHMDVYYHLYLHKYKVCI